MLKGVWINSASTMSYGFCVLADIVIGAPAQKRSTVSIPGADGVIDNSYLYGRPIFDNRKITFRLFSSADEDTWEAKRRALFNAYHGKRVRLTLPQDVPDAGPYDILQNPPYWDGILSFGDTTGYSGSVLPVSVDCAPYQLDAWNIRSQLLSSALGATSWDVTLYNEGSVPAAVEVEVTGTVTLTFTSVFSGESKTVTLQKGVYDTNALYVLGLSADPGSTSISFALPGTADVTCTVKWAERRL